MKKIITTTTTQYPTDALEKFDNLEDWTLIVVGDKKTPKDFKLKNGIYISPDDQEKYNKNLSDLIGWNTHARRNFGHLWARDMRADIVASVDDDNIPLDNWGKDLLVGREVEVHYYENDTEAFDPIGATNYPHLWHRGFPVQLVYERNYSKITKKVLKVDIQADFWNGDPDIDAICRMIYAPLCKFNDNNFPMASNKVGPFGSQNIFFTKELLPYYFFLPHISLFGRMGDIWISFHIQALGYNVVYCKPSVYQKRNPHNLTTDMKDEFIGYERNIDIVKSMNNGTYQYKNWWSEGTCKAYEEYMKCFG
ncbi:MAG: hypothetical protein HQ547_05665 [Candidatus Omnitrophica bacterium]|nr:hypothetical protein [Candidatus Omnitrophota bacterium]